MKILVGMSGGVDSSVAAALLAQAGHEVVGVTFRMGTGAGTEDNGCCSARMVCDAAEVARSLGIKHFVSHVETDFYATVVRPFLDAYAKGQTPNPCVNCNRYIKFPEMLRLADQLGADMIATGHYAISDGGLFRAVDKKKDQSYVLWPVAKEIVQRLVLPLGSLEKSQTREIARSLGLPVADKPDSQDICFVPKGDYREVLSKHGVQMPPGEIVNTSKHKLGMHTGVCNYTIGQRKGLGISCRQPMYVCDIIPQSNRVVVSPKEPKVSQLTLKDMNILGELQRDVVVQTRSHGEVYPARLASDRIAKRAFLIFPEEIRAVAPGQSVVCYVDDQVVAGGVVTY